MKARNFTLPPGKGEGRRAKEKRRAPPFAFRRSPFAHYDVWVSQNRILLQLSQYTISRPTFRIWSAAGQILTWQAAQELLTTLTIASPPFLSNSRTNSARSRGG